MFWVESGARTHDTRNHNPMLCQLSYDHRARLRASFTIGRFTMYDFPFNNPIKTLAKRCFNRRGGSTSTIRVAGQRSRRKSLPT